MADTLKNIALADIEPADDNLRQHVAGIEDLAQSIAFIGLLEPITVTANGTPGKYKIIAGHRRRAALELNGETHTKALVRSGKISDSDRTAAMLIENMQRVDLDIREQSEGVRRLISDHQMSIADVATNLGVSKDWVKARIGISALPDSVFEVSQYDRPLSVEALTMLAELDDTRRERLIKNHPTPRPFHIEDAMGKQRAIALREKQMAKLIKGKHLAITQKQLKKIMATELAETSGPEQEIKILIGAATKIVNQWEKVPEGEWAIVLSNIFDIDKEQLDKRTVYVLTGGAGSQSWTKVVLKQGTAAGGATVNGDGLADEDDLIDARNAERRADHQAACRQAEIEYVEQTKPAELITELLRYLINESLTGWNSHLRVVKVLDRLGLDYADVGVDVADEIRIENIEANVATIQAYLTKNSANLARAAATAVIAGRNQHFEAVAYPDEPEYEAYPDEEDDDYDDSGDPL